VIVSSASDARAYVHEARLVVSPDVDPASVGAEVTVALCGHWQHDGPCRWPHNNSLNANYFRTIFICTPDDEPEVRRRIVAALSGDDRWRLESEGRRDVAEDEQDLAARLARL